MIEDDETAVPQTSTGNGVVPRGRRSPSYLVDVLLAHERGTGGGRQDLTVEQAARSLAGVLGSEEARACGLVLRQLGLDDRSEGALGSTIVRAALGLMLDDAPDGLILAAAATEAALSNLNAVPSIRSGGRRLEAFIAIVERSPVLDFPEERERRPRASTSDDAEDDPP